MLDVIIHDDTDNDEDEDEDLLCEISSISSSGRSAQLSSPEDKEVCYMVYYIHCIIPVYMVLYSLFKDARCHHT